jgi:hypothetical protein
MCCARGVLIFFTARYIDKEEILRVTQEKETLINQRNELEIRVSSIDSAKNAAEEKVLKLESEADSMRTKVFSLEQKRQVAQLDVRKLRTDSDLENQLMEAFPAIKTSMKIVNIPVDEASGFTLKYWAVPMRFSETFLIDQMNSTNYEKQRDKLLQLDKMNLEIIGLQKTITKLEEEKSAAFKEGYDSAYVKYMDVNEKYLKSIEGTSECGIWPTSDWSSCCRFCRWISGRFNCKVIYSGLRIVIFSNELISFNESIVVKVPILNSSQYLFIPYIYAFKI